MSGSSVSTSFVESTDGVTVAVHDLGGDGPPLLFLHATGFHGRCYLAIAEALSDRFHVYAPDLRGHGDATTPDIALPWAGAAQDVLAVVDHLGFDEPVRAAGHSMGGATVVNAELARPGTIKAGWLFEPIIFDPSLAHRAGNGGEMAVGARRRRPTFDSFEAAIERYSGRFPFTDINHRVLSDYVRHGFRPVDDGVTLKCTPEMEARTFEGVRLETFGELGQVEPPMTVLGSGDGMPPALTAPRVAEGLPHGSFVEWADRSHFGPLEDPARAADHIAEVLA